MTIGPADVSGWPFFFALLQISKTTCVTYSTEELGEEGLEDLCAVVKDAADVGGVYDHDAGGAFARA